MKYTLDFGIWGSVFAVPTQIVDKHLKLCGAAHLKVLLTLLRNADSAMELSALAAALNFTQADTQDALNYWLECGILRANQTEDGISLSPIPASQAPPPAASPVAPPVLETASAVQQQPPAVPQSTLPARVPSSPPQRMKPLEIQQLVAANPQLKALLDEAEATLGKLLTTSDVATLASLYDWAGIPADVLLVIICYCKSIGKPNLRYIEKVAISWQEHGVDTLEKADFHMRETLETDRQTQLVRDAFGIHGRALSAKETAFVRQWFSEYHFDLPLIHLAFERAVDRTGKASFPYIGKILSSWHQKNIKTPEDAAREDKAFSLTQEQTRQSSSYNLDEIEQRLLHGSPKLV